MSDETPNKNDELKDSGNHDEIIHIDPKKQRQTIFKLLAHLINIFTSRKYIVFLLAAIAASYALWHKKLEAGPYSELIIWTCLLYFTGNWMHRTIDDGSIARVPLYDRMTDSKFIATVALLIFFAFALWSSVLPPESFSIMTIWISGLYFGVDVAEIISFKNRSGKFAGIGDMFKTPPTKPVEPAQEAKK